MNRNIILAGKNFCGLDIIAYQGSNVKTLHVHLLITSEGDRLNLKSKLCQYVSLTGLLNSAVEIPELELVAYEAADTEKLIKFLMENQ